MFTTKHFIFLLLTTFFIVFVLFITRKKRIAFAIKGFLLVGIVSELIKVFYYIVTNDNGNYLPYNDLPFHLCSIQIIFLFILHYSNNENLKRLLLAFMIPTGLFGGLAALMIPTSSSINGMLILSIQYFFYHATLIAFAIHLLRQKELVFTVKDVFNVLKLLAFMGVIAIYINGMLGPDTNVNFMYVVRPPMDNLPLLNLNQGYIIYILKYALLATFLVLISFSKTFVAAYATSKSKKNTQSSQIIQE